MLLHACYAVSGSDLGYAATRQQQGRARLGVQGGQNPRREPCPKSHMRSAMPEEPHFRCGKSAAQTGSLILDP
eukprot:200707-Rhodomonas_salina.1